MQCLTSDSPSLVRLEMSKVVPTAAASTPPIPRSWNLRRTAKHRNPLSIQCPGWRGR
uniref:Uncharacterized protein n=1 Tax=Oncorhynchus kisutch TaxID=8019 RepID=A0A8C7CMU3_ONCKI